METNGKLGTRGSGDGAHEPLTRIAAALERISPPVAETEWMRRPAFVWNGQRGRGVARVEAPDLALLRGIDRQKARVAENVARHASGAAAHDMLLWGARGMGKSALIRAAVVAAQQAEPGRLALVQVAGDALPSLSRLFTELGGQDRQFLVYLDDLGFGEGEDGAARQLRSWLDGGVEARPANVRLAVTSNRRAIMPRDAAEQGDPLNPRDAVDDKLALADRFGLVLGFHACSQDDYLAIVQGYAEAYSLSYDEGEALEWARERGARSGRIAWHFITELAGREGRDLSRKR